MELLYEIELKYRRDVTKDSVIAWENDADNLPSPKVTDRLGLIGVMLSDVGNLVSLGLRESDIFAHLDLKPAVPRVRFSIAKNIPPTMLGDVFKIDPLSYKVVCDEKRRCTVTFEGMRRI